MMCQEKTQDMSQYFYRASAADFMKIPGGPVAYWLDHGVYELYEECPNICEVSDPRQGMATTDNATYLRSWHEISLCLIGFGCTSAHEGYEEGRYWFPYNKGGDVRKWYGNQHHVVRYEKNGQDLIDLVTKKYPKISDPEFVIKNRKYYFKDSVTWTDLTSSTLSARYQPHGAIFDVAGHSTFINNVKKRDVILAFLNSKIGHELAKVINSSFHFQVGDYKRLPYPVFLEDEIRSTDVDKLISNAKEDWDSYETSWDFEGSPLLELRIKLNDKAHDSFMSWKEYCEKLVNESYILENKIHGIICEKIGYKVEGLQVSDITLLANPKYRYSSENVDGINTRFQSDTFVDLLSYALGCMMGRYSIDKPGLILASQGETLQDYLKQIPSPRFMPDDDAILPLTDQEWFPDDATNRFREFVRVVWGDEHLQENLDFVAESLCLHAIKPRRGESALDTIRRYLSTQFFKDHMRTYKKRPIYWLFSSGKQKAFECLVYLHRYNEGTLARMRTEYVVPLSARLNAYAEKLEKDKEASTSAAETRRLDKEITKLHKQQAELAAFDEKLRHYADQRIALDLDDGVKVNYGKFGDLLADVKAIAGEKTE